MMATFSADFMACSWLRGAGGTHGMAFSSVQYSAAPSVLHIDRTRNWRADLAFCRTTSEAQSGCRADGETSDEVRNAERRAQGRSFRIGNAALKPRFIRGAGAVRYGPDRFAVEFRFEASMLRRVSAYCQRSFSSARRASSTRTNSGSVPCTYAKSAPSTMSR